MTLLLRSITLAVLLAATTSLAQAQTLLLNFGNQTITNWNSLASVNADIAAGSVIDSTGATWAGVAITTDNFGSSLSNSGTYASDGTAPSWTVSDAITTVWWKNSDGAATVVISGLNDSLTYQVDLISARSTAGPNVNARTGAYTLNGLAADSTSDSLAFNAYYDGWLNGDVITWNSATPNSGALTLGAVRPDGSEGAYVTALRLTVIPEPGSAALAGLALSLLVLRRRR